MKKKYSQPNFYHFSETPILLSRWIDQYGESSDFVLDGFSGSGVLGLELGMLPKFIKAKFVLLEKQEDFTTHLDYNVEHFGIKQRYQKVICDFFTFESKDKFDAIIFNPPYFDVNEGRASKDYKRDECHRIVESIEDILTKSSELLKIGGQVFFSYKTQKKIQNRYDDLKLIKAQRLLHEKESFYFFKKFN